MIPTRLLHYFLAINSEQSFTKAAEKLGLSQPTLSKQMNDLENMVGKKLLIRSKKQVTLTLEGEYLRDRARELFSLMEKTESVLKNEGEQLAGEIHIGCAESKIMDFITKVFADLRKKHPAISLHLVSGDADSVMRLMDEGIVDAGILLGPVTYENYDYFDLKQKETFGVLIPKNDPLASKTELTIDDILKLPLIISEQTYKEKHTFAIDSIRLKEFNIVGTYNLVHNATYMVENHIGYALCLNNLVNTSGRNLKFIPLAKELSVEVNLVTKKYQSFSPATRAFLKLLKESVLENN